MATHIAKGPSAATTIAAMKEGLANGTIEVPKPTLLPVLAPSPAIVSDPVEDEKKQETFTQSSAQGDIMAVATEDSTGPPPPSHTQQQRASTAAFAIPRSTEDPLADLIEAKNKLKEEQQQAGNGQNAPSSPSHQYSRGDKKTIHLVAQSLERSKQKARNTMRATCVQGEKGQVRFDVLGASMIANDATCVRHGVHVRSNSHVEVCGQRVTVHADDSIILKGHTKIIESSFYFPPCLPVVRNAAKSLGDDLRFKNPKMGMVCFCNTSKKLHVYDGEKWCPQ